MMYEYKFYAQKSSVSESGAARTKEEVDDELKRFKFKYAGEEIIVIIREEQ